MTDPKQIALAMVVLKHVMDQVKPAQDALREQAKTELDAKDRVAAKTPDGTVVGTISRDAPRPKAIVADPAKLLVWMRDNYPDRIEGDYEYLDEQEVLLVVLAHAPHLVRKCDYLPDHAVNEILKLSEKAGQPVGPGGELDVPGVEVTLPEGTVRVRIEPNAHDAIAAAIRSGLVSLDGTVRPALPEGGAA